MSELTPWFNPEIKPARIGIYKTKFKFHSLDLSLAGYSYWDGKRWSHQASEIIWVNPLQKRGAAQKKMWRGLAKEPK